MPRSLLSWSIAAAVLVSASAARTAPLSPDQPMPPAEVEALVDGAVRLAMEKDHIAGVAVSVVQDDRLILTKGYGFADVAAGRPVDPERTLFRIGSITKTFTWMLVADAVQSGRLRLDAPVNEYLPAPLDIPDDGFKQPIRLRHLVTHTAGFEDRPLDELFIRDPNRLRPLETYLAAHRPARVFEPGAVSAYSNYGPALAGLAVGAAYGQTWHDLLEARILVPAGMSRSTGREPHPARAGMPRPMPPALARDLATGYRWTGAQFEARPFEYVGPAPAGSISSTAGDMARYMRLWLNGGEIDRRQVFGPATAAALRAPLKTYPGGAAAAGGAFRVPLDGGVTAYGHNGGTLNFNTNMLLVPELRLGIFVATNTESGPDLTGRLPYLIVQRFYGSPRRPLAPAPALLEAPGRYEGEFLDARRPFRGLQAFAMRFRPTPVAVAAPGYLTVARERFVPAGSDGLFRNVDHPTAVMAAELRGGRLVRLISSGGELSRVPWPQRTQTITWAAAATALAALAVLLGLFSPARWRSAQSRLQRFAGALRGLAAILWLIAIGAFATALAGALSDNATIVYGWPGPLVLTAAWAALAAAVLSAGAMSVAPLVWAQSGGWGWGRKVRFSVTVALFAGFGLLLATLGALQPWNP